MERIMICPKCNEPIFINPEQTKICPKCKEIIFNFKTDKKE
jgi:Zn finger protein HypA/HybF involved in hydrogenase expression